MFVKSAIAILVLNLIVIEVKPNDEFHPQNEDFQAVESSSSPVASIITDDKPMNADSFPLAHDVQASPEILILKDYRVKNDPPKSGYFSK